MGTLQVVLSFGLSIFFLGLFLNISRLWREWGRVRRFRLILIAWFCLALSHARLIGGESTTGELGLGELLEIFFLLLGSFLTLLLTIKISSGGYRDKLPLYALIAYALLGMVTAFIGPKPLLSIFKSSQLLVFAILASVSLVYARRYQSPFVFVNLVFVMLVLVMVSAALGGVLGIDGAFNFLYSGGLFGMMLNSVVPQIHSNTLGFLSAVLLLMAFRRSMEYDPLRWRFFYLAIACLAYAVMFAAQSRTSYAALLVGMTFLACFTRRMRFVIWIISLLGIIIIFYTALSGDGLGFEESIITYLRRGENEDQLHTMSGRTILWRMGLAMFFDSPFIGHGFQTGVRFGGYWYGLEVGTNMHTAHLQVLVDSGLLGYLFWITYLFIILWACVKAMFRHHPGNSRIDRACIEVAVVGMMIFIRVALGHSLVTLEFVTMLYTAIYIAICTVTNLNHQFRVAKAVSGVVA